MPLNDAIYMIGGLQQRFSGRDFVPLPNNRMIDANLNYIEKAPLKIARCSAPLAVVNDRWILAMGGLVGKDKPTSNVAAFDTTLNQWFSCQDLNSAVYNTSAIVLGGRHVYLMPGQNPGSQKG